MLDIMCIDYISKDYRKQHIQKWNFKNIPYKIRNEISMLILTILILLIGCTRLEKVSGK